MFLPLGDQPNPRGVPWVTYALIGANVAVYLLITLPLSGTAPDPTDPMLREYLRVISEHLPQQVPLREILRHTSAYDLFVFEWGFRPMAPALSTLFTSLFLHAGFMHLFGNMLFLWIYGDNVEYRLGRLAYLFWYLATGAVATLFHTLFALRSPLPLVGASGAISGVLGFYFVWFPRNRVRVFLFLFPFFMDVVMLPARLVLGLFIIVDNLLPFLLEHGVDSGVAHGAHIGGFLAGLAVARFMNRREVAEQPRDFRVAGEKPAEETTISQALADGRFAEAAQRYFALESEATRRLLSPSESLALADWLRAHGHPRAALVVCRRQLRDYPHGPGAAEAHLGAGLVQLQDLDETVPAYQHFIDALDLEPSPEVARAAHAGLDAIAARQKRRLGRA